jgi:clan AA aspartic protease (TIGR02281 family)
VGRHTVKLILALSLLLALHTAANAESIALKQEGGTFVVPVLINDKITLNFTIDSGAADVSIPADVFSTLTRAGTVVQSDFVDLQRYRLADGSIQVSQRFRLRSLRVGNLELRNVLASVSPPQGSLLLGQSFLARLNAWSIDNQRQMLLINESPTTGLRNIVASPSSKEASAAKWVLAGKRGEHAVFIDVSSIRVDRGIRLVSRKLVYKLRTKRGLNKDSDKWVNYIVTHLAVNCGDRRERDDFLSVYYDDGTVYQARISPPEWESVTPSVMLPPEADVTDALESDAMQFICAWTPN